MSVIMGFVTGREWKGPGEAARLTEEGQFLARIAREAYASQRRGTRLTETEIAQIELSIRETENTLAREGEHNWAGWTSRRGVPGTVPEGRRQLEEDYRGVIEGLKAKLAAGVWS